MSQIIIITFVYQINNLKLIIVQSKVAYESDWITKELSKELKIFKVNFLLELKFLLFELF
jgi:hypothetical protein